jgi:hypothetical protein
VGDRGREGGPFGVAVPVLREEEVAFFFCFLLREDSFPLASERLGEPGRFRVAEDAALWRESEGWFGRLEGVLVPLVEEFEGTLDLSPVALFFSSASFFNCSSFSVSVSVSSESLFAILSASRINNNKNNENLPLNRKD